MAKKQKKPESKRPPTARQLSKLQRQQRTQRIVTIAVGVFLALVVAYIGYGYYDQQVKPLHEPVLKINDTILDMDYYTKSLKLYSTGQDATKTSTIADSVTQIIESNNVVIVASKDLGIALTADEVNNALKTVGLPNEKVYRDAVSAQLLTAKLMKDYFGAQVPTKSAAVKAQALLVESEDIAKDVLGRLKSGTDFASLAKEYSLEPTTKEKSGDLGWLVQGFTSELSGDLAFSHVADIAFTLQPGMVSDPTYDESATKGLGYWLVKVTEKDEKKGSHAEGILLGSRNQAEEIRAWLEAGEDFAAVAKKYSQHAASKDNGGDLGWIQPAGLPQPEGVNNRVVAALVPQLQPGGLSQPAADSSVLTKGGYWIVNVTDRDENRALDDQTRQTEELKLFETWLNEQAPKFSFDAYLTPDQKSRALNEALKGKK